MITQGNRLILIGYFIEVHLHTEQMLLTLGISVIVVYDVFCLLTSCFIFSQVHYVEDIPISFYFLQSIHYLTYQICYTYCFKIYQDYFNLTNINLNFILYANDKLELLTSLLQCL